MIRKAAIPIDADGLLEGHFGQARAFAIYTIEDDIITLKEVLTPPPHTPGVLPKWINQNGISVLLASTMGERAKKILDYFNIEVFPGTPVMQADELIEKFIAGKLEFDPHLCDHHHHEHEHNHHNHD